MDDSNLLLSTTYLPTYLPTYLSTVVRAKRINDTVYSLCAGHVCVPSNRCNVRI